MKIFTIGYEATTMGDFLAALKAAGVEQVIDVRALPLSRRPGFSKNILAASLAEAGIGYVHLKQLGTPKEGRDAAKKGDVKTLNRVYDIQLGLPEAQMQAAQMRALAAESLPRCSASNGNPRTATARCCWRRRARGWRWSISFRDPVSLSPCGRGREPTKSAEG